MKKNLFIAFLLTIMVLALAWRSSNKQRLQIPLQNPPSSPLWGIDFDSEFPNAKLPENIASSQIKEVYEFEGKKYALFYKSNLNLPVNSDIRRSGVLLADKNSERWNLIVEILDKEYSAANNPYKIWYENNLLYLLVVDQYGAGSGEGNAKLIEINPEIDNFNTISCFYYTVENYIKAAESSEGLINTVKTYIKTFPESVLELSDSYCSNFEVVNY